MERIPSKGILTKEAIQKMFNRKESLRKSSTETRKNITTRPNLLYPPFGRNLTLKKKILPKCWLGKNCYMVDIRRLGPA